MNNSSTYRFTLDLHSTQSQVSIPASVEDTSRILCISFSDGGDPYYIEDGTLALLSVKRPNGEYFEEYCMIESNAIVKYSFLTNTCTMEGIHDCQITLANVAGETIASPRFTMVVSERVVSFDDLDISDDDKTRVELVLEREAERQEREKDRIANEIARQEAEEAREAAEEERKQSSAERYIKSSDIIDNHLIFTYKDDKTQDMGPVAAGFGTPEATVGNGIAGPDSSTGLQPTVTVTVDENSPDAAKIFKFAFDNIVGAGISGITKQSAEGLTTTYCISLTDGRKAYFTVTDGYTPVKGTDYFTDADKKEIAQAALDLLTFADEVSV